MYGVLSFCSLLLYCGGITWFVLLSHVQFSERCYFSENALLPGLVASEFTSSQEEIQNLNLDIVSSNRLQFLAVKYCNCAFSCSFFGSNSLLLSNQI